MSRSQTNQERLAAVDWAQLHDVDAQAIYTFAVLACRANRGPCFCGTHVTPVASATESREMRIPDGHKTRNVSESKPTPLPVENATSGKTRRKILVALVQLNRPLNKLQIGLYAKLSSTSGGFGVAMAELKREGKIIADGGQFRVTAEGRAEAGDIAPLPTGGALFEFWCSRLGTTEGKILRALRPHGTVLSKPAIGDATGLSSSSGGFGVAIARVKRMGLVVGNGWAMELSPDFRRMLEPTIEVFDHASRRSVLITREGNAVKR